MRPAMPDLADTPAPRVRDRRQERLDRWRRPLVTRWDRFSAWTNMVLVDHAFFRMAYLNLHRVSDRAWRSAQPTPYQIRALARRGVRTIVSLRGGQSFGSLPLQIEACSAAGLCFENFVLRSRAIPSVEELRDLQAFFAQIEYPVLFHCKSGADRAGMMSALFLALHEGKPVSEARRQLGLRYGHIRQGKTGVLDAFFDAYQADQPDGAMPLVEWIETRYDRDAITAAFRPGRLGDLLTDRLLGRE